MESLGLPDIAEELEEFLENSMVDYDGVVREVVKKAKIGQYKDLKIILHPDDHFPYHFHVQSNQRNIDTRFIINTLKVYPGDKIDMKMQKQIRYYFCEKAPEKYLEMKQEAMRYWPEYSNK